VAKRKNYGRVSGRQNSRDQVLGSRPGRKYVRKSKKIKLPAGLIFWTAFLVLIAGLFFINRDHIRKSLENTQLLEKISPNSPGERSLGEGALSSPAAAEQPPAVVQSPPRPIEQRDSPSPAAGSGVAEAGTPVETRAPIEAGTATRTETPTGGAPAVPSAPASPDAVPAVTVQTSPAGRLVQSYTEQVLYFIRVSDDGEIIRSKAVRRIPVSGTPLQDTLEALIAGPDSGEISRGILSLIPPDTKILSAVIEGNTARISFSEEFQYNTAGMEGFAAQLIQVIWTATEFPNIQDVQILIEGNRIDHLGEGILIWNPLNRQSF
jgi:spore germination protein GerM